VLDLVDNPLRNVVGTGLSNLRQEKIAGDPHDRLRGSFRFDALGSEISTKLLDCAVK
jgi:hypothetical protein